MERKYQLVDKLLADNEKFKLSLFALKFNQIMGKLSRIAYNKFDAKTPSQCNKIVDYICDNYVPKILLNKWR